MDQRFKAYDYNQDQIHVINYQEQLRTEPLAYAIHHLVDTRIGLDRFEDRYSCSEFGPKAYDPRLLLKIVLYAYSQGVLHSRKMEKACKCNMIYASLGCGITPDHSTFAAFISDMGDLAQEVFEQILLACEQANLLSYTHLSLDGVKLPSNASREWSGKHGQLARKRDKIRIKIKEKIAEHKNSDHHFNQSEQAQFDSQLKRLEKDAQKIDEFLKENDPKIGTSGKEIIDNITDPDSCSMKTRHGVAQGYNAQALADDKNQVIVYAGTEGTGHDHTLVQRALDTAASNLNKEELSGIKLTADCQYHSEENLQACQKHGVDAYIPDNRFRQRDPAFEGQKAHKGKSTARKRFKDEDFEYDQENDQYICPNGKYLKIFARKTRNKNHYYRRYASNKKDCNECALRDQCLMNKTRKTRCIQISLGKVEETLREQMKAKIDLPESRQIYGKRMHIIEPVFGNIRYNKAMNRFTLRGKNKVNAQWLLYCCVHNIEKWAKHASFSSLKRQLEHALRAFYLSISTTKLAS